MSCEREHVLTSPTSWVCVLLLSTWFGTFLLDGEEVVKAKLFPKDPEELASRMLRVEEGEVLDEEKEMARGLDDFLVTERRLEKIGGDFVEEQPPFLRPEDSGFDGAVLRETMIVLGKMQLRRAVQPADHIIQAVRSLDDLNQSANLVMERLRDWYALHFPELARMVNPERYLELIADHGRRDEMPLEVVESVGAELGGEDLEIVQDLARLTRSLNRRRSSLSEYLETKMTELAPNVTHLAGPVLGARLISLAGGLEELAKLPASTIQLLGAEKALFRHLRKGTKPPKHGVLLQHPWVHQAPYWQRGAIARGLASKLAIAARADAYSKRFVAEELREQVEKLVAKVAESHREPPKKRPRPRPRSKGRGRR